MNSAIAQFCLEIIAKHGEPAPRLCNKDPLTLKMGTYVIELFPNVIKAKKIRKGKTKKIKTKKHRKIWIGSGKAQQKAGIVMIDITFGL